MRKNLQDTELSKQSILEAAEAVFAKHGYVGANIDEIAKMTGMTKGAIFWHYDNKLGLFKAVLEKAVRRVREISEQVFTKEGGIIEQCQEVVLEVQRDVAFKVLLQLGSMNDKHLTGDLDLVRRDVAGFFQKMYKRMKAAQKRGELKASVNVMEILMAIVLLMSGFTQLEKSNQLLMSEQTFDHESVIRMVFEGLNSYQK